MKRAALVIILALVGCSEKVAVDVQCVTTAAPAVDCSVTQTQGKSEVEACWDFEVTCGNGALVTAPRTCQKVKGGGTAKVTIPGDKLSGVDKCGGSDPQAKVSNLTLDGKAVN